MSYLITGGAGFIGSYLIREILKQEPFAKIIAIVKPSANLWRIQDLLDKIILIKDDMKSGEKLIGHLLPYHPKIMFHLAWEGVQGIHRDGPVQLENYAITESLFCVMQAFNIETFVGLGSQAEYGIKNHPISETEALNPVTLYAKTKVDIASLCEKKCNTFGVKFIWLRLFSTYGPLDNGSWLIPYVISEFRANRSPLLTHGKQRWDYLYVEDVARGIWHAAFLPNTGYFNLGSGVSCFVHEIVNMIYTYIEPQVQLQFGSLPEKENQPAYLEANMSLFFSLSSWRPEMALAKGLRVTCGCPY